jgi:DNA-binding response OmpR family regulator
MSQQCRVLFIEASQQLCRVAELALTTAGYAAEICHKSEDALQMISSRAPDVVIVHSWIERPGAGEDALRALRSNEETATIPVILTHEGELGDVMMDQHSVLVRRPYDWEIMLDCISQMTSDPQGAS